MSARTTQCADVLLLTNATLPEKTGGLERYVRELGTALAGSGRRVVLVAKRMDPSSPLAEEHPDGVRVERIPVLGKRNPLFAPAYPFLVGLGVLRSVRRHPDALVHAHFAVPALVLALLPRRWSRRYAYTFHAPVWKELLSERQDSYFLPRPLQRAAVSLLRAAERRVLVRADHVLVLSEFMRGQLAELAPEAAARAQLVPGGVDTDWFTPGTPETSAWAAEAAPLLVTARRLVPRTGVVELVRAMAEVVREHPGARLAVIGEGGRRALVEEEIARLGLGEHVRLLGRVSDEELRDWYRRADLAVTPTQQLEGFGLSTAEAMACGAVPVVTPIGANEEVVRGLPDFCVAAGTKAAERTAAERNAAEQRGPVSRDAVRRAAEAWSWPAVAAAHAPLFERRKEAVR